MSRDLQVSIFESDLQANNHLQIFAIDPKQRPHLLGRNEQRILEAQVLNNPWSSIVIQDVKAIAKAFDRNIRIPQQVFVVDVIENPPTLAHYGSRVRNNPLCYAT